MNEDSSDVLTKKKAKKKLAALFLLSEGTPLHPPFSLRGSFSRSAALGVTTKNDPVILLPRRPLATRLVFQFFSAHKHLAVYFIKMEALLDIYEVYRKFISTNNPVVDILMYISM